MRTRIVGLLVSLGTIGLAILSLSFVAKITEIGGDSYNWEYFPPIILLVLGIAASGYWLWRIFQTR